MRISDWSSDVCSSDLLDGPAANDLTHHGIEGQAVGIVHILVSGQSSEHRLPEQSVKPMERVLPGAAVSQRLRRQIGPVGQKLRFWSDRKSVVRGKRGSVSVDLGGPRTIEKKKK